MELSQYADTIEQAIYNLDYYGLYYFFIINGFFALLVILSFPQIYRRFKELHIEGFAHLLASEALPPITVIAPTYNYEKGVIDAVQSFLQLSYPKKEVLIINDGSTDQTLEVLRKRYELVEVPNLIPSRLKSEPIRALYRSKIYPELMVLDKKNGGKGDSLNAGLNYCSSPLFVSLDIDTIIEEDALLRMIRPFISRSDMAGEGGTLRVLNGCTVKHGKLEKIQIPKNILPGIQVGEYLRAFLFGRLGWNNMGGNFIVSGAFGLFDREKVIEVGGYDKEVIGEDMDLAMQLIEKIRGKGKKCFIGFVPDPVAWTEVPSTIRSLGRQRERWHRGLIYVMVKHFRMFLNPKYGLTGLIAMPYLAFGELFQPIFELIYYVAVILGFAFGILDLNYFLLFFMVTMGISIVLTLSCLLMEQMTFKRYKSSWEFYLLLLYALFEYLGYRQAYFIWRIMAFFKSFRKDRSW